MSQRLSLHLKSGDIKHPKLIVKRGLLAVVCALPLVMMVPILIPVVRGHAPLMNLLHLLPLIGLFGWVRLMMRCPLTGMAMIMLASVMWLLCQFGGTPEAW